MAFSIKNAYKLLILNFFFLLFLSFMIVFLWKDHYLAYFVDLFFIQNLFFTFFSGLVISFIFLFYILLMARLNFFSFPKDTTNELIFSLSQSSFGPLFVAFSSSISEELFFRGVLIPLLLTTFSPFLSIVISSTLFLIIHISQYKKHFHLLSFVFFFSVFSGLIFYLTNNLWIVIIAHFLYNYVVCIWTRKGIFM